MPTYRSINIALHSQFDIEILPEYYPPPLPPPHPLSPSISIPPGAALNPQPTATATATSASTSTVPPLVDDATSTTSVHVPILPGSQFWLAYSVSPPVPEGHYFLFKLYIDGVRVVSWSTGKEDGWRGTMVFGLFEGENGKGVERRVLCFGEEGGDRNAQGEGLLEVKIHRANGRRRVEREVAKVERMGGDGAVRLVNAGRAGSEQPKRFYRFQLIDPVDQPFATFRYYCRSWEWLREMGLLDHEYYAESEGFELDVIEPEEHEGQEGSNRGNISEIVSRQLDDVVQTDNDGISVHDWSPSRQQPGDTCRQASEPSAHLACLEPSPSNRDKIASGSYIPRGAPPSEVSTGSPPPPGRLSHKNKNKNRLSVPPSIKLDAPDPTPRPLPVPPKNDVSSTAYRPHPAYPVEEWTVRTPSPVRSVRDGINTPPPGKRGMSRVGGGLMGVIQSTWKRSVSAAQATKKGEVGEEKRSVSY